MTRFLALVILFVALSPLVASDQRFPRLARSRSRIRALPIRLSATPMASLSATPMASRILSWSISSGASTRRSRSPARLRRTSCRRGRSRTARQRPARRKFPTSCFGHNFSPPTSASSTVAEWDVVRRYRTDGGRRWEGAAPGPPARQDRARWYRVPCPPVVKGGSLDAHPDRRCRGRRRRQCRCRSFTGINVARPDDSGRESAHPTTATTTPTRRVASRTSRTRSARPRAGGMGCTRLASSPAAQRRT